MLCFSRPVSMLQNYSSSLVSRPQTLLQHSVSSFSLCAVKLDNFVFILPGLSSLKILYSMFFIKLNRIVFITVHMCGLYVRTISESVKQPTQSSDPKFPTFQNKSCVIHHIDIKHCSNRVSVVCLLWRHIAREEVILWMLLPWRWTAPVA